jgi:hypothetical protein
VHALSRTGAPRRGAFVFPAARKRHRPVSRREAQYGPRHCLASKWFTLDIPGTCVHPRALVRGFGKLFASTRVSSFTDSTVKHLRTVVIEQLKQPEAPTAQMITSLGNAGREARERNIPPEVVIVSFKQIWSELAQSSRPQYPDQYERLRQRLVTVCIQAYYAE